MQEERQRTESVRLMEEHGPGLAREAAAALDEDPQQELVGFVVTPDAAEAEHLADLLRIATGEDLRGRGLVGLVPREFAVALLRSQAPATLDWLEPSSAPERPARLPLVVATRDGFRLGAQEFGRPGSG